MQVMLDTSSVDDRDPAVLRALAKFLEAVAVTYEPAKDAEPSINGEPEMTSISDIVEIRTQLEAEKFFGPDDSLPADNFEKGIKAPSAPIPLPPPVFVALVPSPPVLIPPPPGIAPPVELDSAGVAYDANLHSSTRSKTIDGKWKARRHRGANVTGVTSVQGVKIPPGQETAAITAYAGPQAPPPIPPPPSTLAPPADDADVEVEADAPSALDFPTLINHVTQGMTTGAITQARIAEVLAEYKLDSLFALNTRPALVSPVAVALGVAA